MIAPRLFIHTRRHPSAILLLVQLLGMLSYPFIEGTRAGQVAFNCFGIVVLAFAIRMVRRTPGEVRVSWALAAFSATTWGWVKHCKALPIYCWRNRPAAWTVRHWWSCRPA